MTLPAFSEHSALESLPADVLDIICEYIAASDPKRRSLFAFSLASHRCLSSATRQRFERIRLSARGPESLRSDLARWVALLTPDVRTSYVRRVKVTGSMPLGRDTSVADLDHPEAENGDDFSDHPKILVPFDGANPRLDGPGEKQRHDEAWRPLAEFIGRLPGLRDFVFACSGRFPTCVLSALHALPRCRLHVQYFSLRSLYQRPDEPRDIDADDLALATSPVLHSVDCVYSGYNEDGLVEYNEEAVLAMAAGATPALREVRMFHRPPGSSLAMPPAVRDTRLPLRLLRARQPAHQRDPDPDHAPPPAGHLRSLAFAGAHTYGDQLAAWARATSFAHLRALALPTALGAGVLAALARAASSGGLSGLRALDLRVAADVYAGAAARDVEGPARALLRALPPLEDLALAGHVSPPVLDAVLERHGPALRRLVLAPDREFALRGEGARALARACPGLREVELLVRRSGGDAEEVGVYRALGEVRGLRRVRLRLECAAGEAPDERPRRERMRAQLRWVIPNVAVDEALAVAVFGVVDGARAGGGVPLERLEIRIAEYDELGPDFDHGFSLIARWIGRSWVCEKGVEGKVVAREVDTRDRLEIATNADWIGNMEEDHYDGGVYRSVWEEIWPQEGIWDWREGWWSLPLALGE